MNAFISRFLPFILFPSITVPTNGSWVSEPNSTLANGASTQTFSIENNPVLKSLSQHAPRTPDGKIIIIPKIDFNSLNDPLQGKYVLLSFDGKTFTIIPQPSLLFDTKLSWTKQIIQTKIPRAAYLPALAFFNSAGARFAVARLSSDNLGRYHLSASDKAALLDQYPGQLILIVDQMNGLPVPKTTGG